MVAGICPEYRIKEKKKGHFPVGMEKKLSSCKGTGVLQWENARGKNPKRDLREGGRRKLPDLDKRGNLEVGETLNSERSLG